MREIRGIKNVSLRQQTPENNDNTKTKKANEVPVDWLWQFLQTNHGKKTQIEANSQEAVPLVKKRGTTEKENRKSKWVPSEWQSASLPIPPLFHITALESTRHNWPSLILGGLLASVKNSPPLSTNLLERLSAKSRNAGSRNEERPEGGGGHNETRAGSLKKRGAKNVLPVASIFKII